MPFKAASFSSHEISGDFLFDSAAVKDTGTVYHYLKSNIDGSVPSDVYIYITSPLSTESFKIYPGAATRKKTDLVVATYDSEYTCIKTINAYFIYPDGKKELNATGELINGNTFGFTIKKPEKSYSVEVGYTPSFIYNFDFCDFFFMQKFLVNKEKNFDIGVVGLLTNLKFVYSGKANVFYMGNEIHDTINCRKYLITGEAFNGKKGTLYINPENNFPVDFIMPVPNNPSFNSLRMHLMETFGKSPEEWKQFIIEQTKKITGLL